MGAMVIITHWSGATEEKSLRTIGLGGEKKVKKTERIRRFSSILPAAPSHGSSRHADIESLQLGGFTFCELLLRFAVRNRAKWVY